MGDDPNQLKVIHLYAKRSQNAIDMVFSRQTDDSIVDKFRKGYKRIQKNDIYIDILKNYGFSDI